MLSSNVTMYVLMQSSSRNFWKAQNLCTNIISLFLVLQVTAANDGKLGGAEIHFVYKLRRQQAHDYHMTVC